MAGNPATSVLSRNTGFGTEPRDESVVYVATEIWDPR